MARAKMAAAAIRTFFRLPDPAESWFSPNTAKDGASVELAELEVEIDAEIAIATGTAIRAASCDGLACSDSAGTAVTSLAGAGAAADPAADLTAPGKAVCGASANGSDA